MKKDFLKIGNKVLKSRLIVGTGKYKNLKDLHSGMRAYRKGFLKDLSINPEGDAFPVEVLLTSILYKKKYKIIPIKYNERIGKIKMNVLKSTYWTIKRIFRVRFKKI